MFDFRYHALSLVAVFLALALGIVLGVTIGDSLVSQAQQNLREDLRGDVERAREAEAEAEAQLEGRDEALAEAFPQLAYQRLSGRDVALVSTGELPTEVEQSVEEAVEVAGGEVDSVSVVEAPIDFGALARAAGGRYQGLTGATAGELDLLGRGVGLSIVRGGSVARRLSDEAPESFRGEYLGADAVVFFRTPAESEGSPTETPADGRVRESRERFEAAMLEAMSSESVPVVGVEQSDTEPSRVPFYARNDISSVDSVDLPSGRLALVYTLDGVEDAQGSYGSKATAERALPVLPEL